MEFNKLSSPSLKELFVKEIEDMIMSGELSIGEKLPSERELSEKMGVSRIVINSGLNELARVGFVNILPRKGAYIADYRRTGSVETLNTILRYNGGVFKKRDMRSLLEFRLIVEELAIKLAIPEITESDLIELKSMLFDFKNSITPSDSALNIFRFHHEICAISSNIMLPIIFYSFKPLAVMLWERYFQLHGNEALYQSTAMLYVQLQKRETEKALATFRSSLQMTIDGVVSIYYE